MSGEFVARMEDVLDLYQPEYNPERPVVCFDETSRQLTGEVRPPIEAAPGRVARYDTEYQRNGTRNLFMICEPKGGWRHVEVTERRTAVDFAHQMRWLVDEAYPDAEVVRLVLDNLNTHKLGSLYEAFEPCEARRIAQRLEFHYTPTHGSWLNMAEIELSVFSRGCLNRRISDEAELRREVAALERERNAARSAIDWRFTTQDARRKLQHIYPTRPSGNGTRPKYLLYYTVDLTIEGLRERLVLIDTDPFPDFDSWDLKGQPITDAIPVRYGRPRVKRCANVDSESEDYRPLDTTTSAAVFNRLREEFHDVIWAGGGTHNNEVFTYIVKLLLCKIYDEKETEPECEYQFQRLGDETSPEDPASFVGRLNELYRRSEETYLALPTPTEGPAFDPVRLPPEKLAYVASRLEGLSVTENVHPGDLLGEFFEQIVSLDFTQSKGQFFTPIILVRFMLALCGAVDQAEHVMRHVGDSHGRPRLPFIIDPSCGSGSFLIEYMKLITDKLGTPEVSRSLPNRIREYHDIWFGGTSTVAR